MWHLYYVSDRNIKRCEFCESFPISVCTFIWGSWCFFGPNEWRMNEPSPIFVKNTLDSRYKHVFLSSDPHFTFKFHNIQYLCMFLHYHKTKLPTLTCATCYVECWLSVIFTHGRFVGCFDKEILVCKAGFLFQNLLNSTRFTV